VRSIAGSSGCVNLANLTLARGTSRAREVAVRAALGAGRGRLVRQFLTESVVLALGGGALGIALGNGMIAGLARLLPPYFLPSEARVAMDSRALLFVLAVSIVTGVLFGLAPALQATKPDLTGSLKEGGRGTSGDSVRRRLRSGLVVIEIALAFILLTGAGLLIRSFVSLQRVDPGFDATNVLTMGLPMPERLFVNGERANRHIERVLTRLAAVPGVREAAFTSMLPLQGWGYAMPCIIAGRPAGDPNAGGVCFHKMVTPSYFSALRMRIERGRGLAPNDIKAAPPALVVNRTFVNRYLSGTDPIGQRVKIKEIVPAGASSARKSRGRSSGSWRTRRSIRWIRRRAPACTCRLHRIPTGDQSDRRQRQALPQDHAEQPACRCAKRGADADLVRALRRWWRCSAASPRWPAICPHDAPRASIR
jgi:putative ABC transport system permease protein